MYSNQMEVKKKPGIVMLIFHKVDVKTKVKDKEDNVRGKKSPKISKPTHIKLSVVSFIKQTLLVGKALRKKYFYG